MPSHNGHNTRLAFNYLCTDVYVLSTCRRVTCAQAARAYWPGLAPTTSWSASAWGSNVCYSIESTELHRNSVACRRSSDGVLCAECMCHNNQLVSNINCVKCKTLSTYSTRGKAIASIYMAAYKEQPSFIMHSTLS